MITMDDGGRAVMPGPRCVRGRGGRTALSGARRPAERHLCAMSDPSGRVPAALGAALADRYRIERELGRGGMATVYLARDLRHDRDVAIKVLHPELATALGADRFLREIQIAANLQHPHILPLLDSGVSAGFLYYVMPHVKGESLREKLARERELPVHDAVRILRDVTDALAHAHDAGIVHRDIKPENVMLSGKHALVMDFGVAKALSEAAGRPAATDGGAPSLTTAGVALGTPTYMAPEQAAADPHTDHRADIYAVGILAYELLAGSPPFRGTSAQAILAAHLTQVPEPLAQHRDVPPALAELVMKCLQKRPADRWQRADEMVRLLEAALTPGGGVTPVALAQRPARATGRRRWIGAACATAAVVALGWLAARQYGGGRVPVVGSLRPPDAGTIAVLPFENVGGDSTNEAYADGISDDIRAALGKIGLHAAARNSSYAFKGRRFEPAEVGRKLRVASYLTGTFRRAGHDLKVTAELVNVRDGTATWTDSYRGSVDDIFRVQDSIATAVAGMMKVTLGAGQRTAISASGTTDVEAHDLFQQAVFFHGKYTERDLRHAIALYEKSSVRDPKYAAPWAGLAMAWINLADDWLPPREAYPKAKVAVQRALALDAASIDAWAASGLIRVFYDWDFDEAEREFERSLPIDTTAIASRSGAHGFVLMHRGQLSAAIAFKQRAVDLDPLLPLLRWDLARALLDAQLVDSAASVLRGIRELDAHYTWLPIASGLLRLRRAQYADALREVQQGDTLMSYAASLMAQCEAVLGRRGDAVRRVRALETARRGRYIDGAMIARVHAALGDRDAAFRWLDSAFVDRSAQMGQLYVFTFDPIRSDPRFRALEQRVRAAAGKP